MDNGLTLNKLKALLQLMRLDKPIGTLLLLWPTYWSLWLSANSFPPLPVFLVFTAGVIVMRAAGCVINDYADRKIDGHVKRTRQRPLPSGRVSEREAKLLFFVLVLLAFALVLMLNRNTILLSVVGIFLAAVYPFMKRFTALPQVVLGAAFGWSIPMAWMAVSNSVPAACWLLFAANLCWTVAYDTQYAMVDRDDDLKIGVKSTAILFGRLDKLIIGILQLLTLILLIQLGRDLSLHNYYYGGVVLAGVFFVYQQKLIAGRQREACFQAFLNNNWAGLVIFLGVMLSTLPFINLM